MTQHAHLDPRPFALPGGPIGVLLIHGFTGAPPEMRPLAEYLHAAGLTVHAPLLPGHGTVVTDMNRCRWTDWAAAVEAAFVELQARCRPVFVGGLSLGSLLALNLAAQRRDVAGVIAYSPPPWPADRLIWLTPVARFFIRARPKTGEPDYDDPETERRLWCYDEDPVPAAYEVLKLMLRVRRLLPAITCPALVVDSARDRSIHPTSGRRTFERLGSTDKERLALDRSGHCVTVDSQRQLVAERTLEFILRHA